MTSSRRRVRSRPVGSSNSARASDSVFLAREMRWPIVASLVRNPRAISAVVSPPTRRSVSAARDSAVSEGWQHRKMSRRTSSSMWSTWASRSGISTSSPAPARSSSATLRRRLSARRKWSMPRRFAVVISHAAGFSGTPVAGHCSRAATSASCARSSASSTSRVIRVRAPTRRADSARHAATMAPIGSSVLDSAGTQPA